MYKYIATSGIDIPASGHFTTKAVPTARIPSASEFGWSTGPTVPLNSLPIPFAFRRGFPPRRMRMTSASPRARSGSPFPKWAVRRR